MRLFGLVLLAVGFSRGAIRVWIQQFEQRYYSDIVDSAFTKGFASLSGESSPWIVGE